MLRKSDGSWVCRLFRQFGLYNSWIVYSITDGKMVIEFMEKIAHLANGSGDFLKMWATNEHICDDDYDDDDALRCESNAIYDAIFTTSERMCALRCSPVWVNSMCTEWTTEIFTPNEINRSFHGATEQ